MTATLTIDLPAIVANWRDLAARGAPGAGGMSTRMNAPGRKRMAGGVSSSRWNWKRRR